MGTTSIFLRKQLIHDTYTTKVEVFNFSILKGEDSMQEIKVKNIYCVDFWRNFSSAAEALNYLKSL